MIAYKDFLFINCFWFLCSLPNYSFCSPSGIEVILGDVSFSCRSEGVLTVEASDRAIIHYDGFSLKEGECVQFIQPSSSSSVLNKVTGKDPSLILGQIKGNGKVFLVNQNGIYFGASSQVDVGSLIATTMNIQEDDFSAGRFIFTADGKSSCLVNAGDLMTDGDCILLAPKIKNEGAVVAKTGKIVLASGEKIALDFVGDGLVSFAIEEKLVESCLIQEGSLKALQGEVFLSMGGVLKMVDSLINVDGLFMAEAFIEKEEGIFLVDSSYIEGQEVYIEGGEGVALIVNGEIYAKQYVHIKGEHVQVDSLSKIALASTGSIEISSQVKTEFAGEVITKNGVFTLESNQDLIVHAANIEAGTWNLSGHIALSCDLITKGGDLFVRGPLDIKGQVQIDTLTGNSSFLEEVKGDDLFLKGKEIHFLKEMELSSFHVLEAETLFLSADLITKAGEVFLGAPLSLLQDVKIDTTAQGTYPYGSCIMFKEEVLGNHRLELNAGSKGTLTIQKGIGSSSLLSAVLMNGQLIELQGDIRADGGTIIFDGPVVLTNTVTISDFGPTGIIFLDTVNCNGSLYSLQLVAPRGQVGFFKGVGLVSPLQNLTVEASEIHLKSDIYIAGTATFDGPTFLLADVSFTGSALSFSKTLDGSYHFSCDVTPLGAVTFENRIGSQVRLGDLHIISANDVRAKDIFASTIRQDNGSGITVLDGEINTNGRNGITLKGTEFFIRGGVKTTNTGQFSLEHVGTVTLEADCHLSGPFIDLGSGLFYVSGDIITEQNDITFKSHTYLTDDVMMSTQQVGEGSISFVHQLEGSYSLVLAAGLGDISFLQEVGSTSPLGDILIENVNQLTLAKNLQAESFTQLSGLGVGTYEGSLTTTGVMGIYIFSQYLDFAGKTSGQVLKTVDQGNVILNSWYKQLGSKQSPIELSILEGSGTAFEGSSHNVYFSSEKNEVGKICTVRVNPGSEVFYQVDSSAFKNVTPNICCTNIPPSPPGPPPPPHHHHGADLQDELFYIPGIYTNYWEFKDTLGAPWYFNEGLRNDTDLFRSKIYWLLGLQEEEDIGFMSSALKPSVLPTMVVEPSIDPISAVNEFKLIAKIPVFLAALGLGVLGFVVCKNNQISLKRFFGRFFITRKKTKKSLGRKL